MKTAICFDGIDDEALVAALPDFLRACATVEAWCAHGNAVQRLVEDAAQRHHGPVHPPHPPHHRSLDEEQARAIAARGAALLQDRGIASEPHTVGSHDAEHALADASGADVLLVLGAGHAGGGGPRSIGHVTRFVVDHARGPVLVVRPCAAGASAL